jgi:hypothetical protein
LGIGDSGRIEIRAATAASPTTKTDKFRRRAKRPNSRSNPEDHLDPARGQQNAEATAMRVRPSSIASNEMPLVVAW